jgi:hypothetical protein
MLVKRCPHCDLPLLADEVIDGLCPTCGGQVEEPVPDVELVPAPPTPPVDWGKFLLGCLAGGVLALLLAWPISALLQAGSLSYEEVQALRQEKEQAEKEARDALDARLTAQKKLIAAERTLREKEETFQQAQEAKSKAEQERADAQAQLKAKGEQVGQILEQFNELKKEFAALLAARPREPPVQTVNINQPDGQYVLPNLDNGRSVKLVGRVKTLRLNSINNATLDASELQVREIIVAGTINGGSRVRLSAPDGKVTVQEINGRSTVEIRAPGGSVTIRSIMADSQVTLTAKEIDLADFLDGDRTQVTATVTSGGQLRFADLRGSSRLHWKKDKPTDPEPRIDKGTIKPAAEFRKLD